MDYTTANSYVTHASTGRRMHEDSAPIPTAVSARDMNQVIWSLMKLLADAGISAATFNPDDPATYNRVSLAVQAMSNGLRVSDFTGSAQSLASAGFQKLPGGLILQWASTSFADISPGSAGTSGSITLPVSFPTACLHAFLTASVNSGGVGNFATTITALSSSALSWNVVEWSGEVNAGVLHVLAIGY